MELDMMKMDLIIEDLIEIISYGFNRGGFNKNGTIYNVDDKSIENYKYQKKYLKYKNKYLNLKNK